MIADRMELDGVFVERDPDGGLYTVRMGESVLQMPVEQFAALVLVIGPTVLGTDVRVAPRLRL